MNTHINSSRVKNSGKESFNLSSCQSWYGVRGLLSVEGLDFRKKSVDESTDGLKRVYLSCQSSTDQSSPCHWSHHKERLDCMTLFVLYVFLSYKFSERTSWTVCFVIRNSSSFDEMFVSGLGYCCCFWFFMLFCQRKDKTVEEFIESSHSLFVTLLSFSSKIDQLNAVFKIGFPLNPLFQDNSRQPSFNSR